MQMSAKRARFREKCSCSKVERGYLSSGQNFGFLRDSGAAFMCRRNLTVLGVFLFKKDRECRGIASITFLGREAENCLLDNYFSFDEVER